MRKPVKPFFKRELCWEFFLPIRSMGSIESKFRQEDLKWLIAHTSYDENTVKASKRQASSGTAPMATLRLWSLSACTKCTSCWVMPSSSADMYWELLTLTRTVLSALKSSSMLFILPRLGQQRRDSGWRSGKEVNGGKLSTICSSNANCIKI